MFLQPSSSCSVFAVPFTSREVVEFESGFEWQADFKGTPPLPPLIILSLCSPSRSYIPQPLHAPSDLIKKRWTPTFGNVPPACRTGWAWAAFLRRSVEESRGKRMRGRRKRCSSFGQKFFPHLVKKENLRYFFTKPSPFLAVQNSSIGDLVTHSLRDILILTLQSDPRFL